MHQFHLGPVGGLRALPSPSLGGGPDATAARIGRVHRSLAGRVTVDRLAVKRAWTLTWPYLDPDTHAWLDALHLGAVAGPVWLLDPQRRNRVPVPVAAGGSIERTTSGVTPTLGGLAWTPDAPTGGTGLTGGWVWTVPAADSLQLLADPVPVLAGEALCVSAWAASTTVPVGLIAAFYDRAGVFAGLISSPTTTTPATGQRLTLPLTATANAATARIGLITDTSAGGQVATTGWQLEPGTAASGWAPGGAAAQVAIDALTAAYPLPGAWATTLTLLEV